LFLTVTGTRIRGNFFRMCGSILPHWRYSLSNCYRGTGRRPALQSRSNKKYRVLLAGEAEYTCFHDVDYLPVSADYSWAEVPT
jgi:hypothetical protein